MLKLADDSRPAWTRVAILSLLVLAVFRAELPEIVRVALEDPEAAHFFAAPLLVGLLLARGGRGQVPVRFKASWWGVALLLPAFLVFFVSSWPFNYAYPRRMSVIPALAGAALAAGGAPMLRLLFPALLVLAVSIPTGSRYYAFLIIRPETWTLSFSEEILGLLPGAFVELQGSDLHYERGADSGVVLLGEPHRGASLLLSGAAIFFFSALWRPAGRAMTALALVAAGPLLLMINMARMILIGILFVMTGAEVEASWPWVAGAAAALTSCWLAGVLVAQAGHVMRIAPGGRSAS